MFSVVYRAKTMFGYCLQQFSFSLSGHTRTACIVEHLITKAVVSLCLCSINANRKKKITWNSCKCGTKKKLTVHKFEPNYGKVCRHFPPNDRESIQQIFIAIQPVLSKKSTRKTAASVSYFMMFFFFWFFPLFLAFLRSMFSVKRTFPGPITK